MNANLESPLLAGVIDEASQEPDVSLAENQQVQLEVEQATVLSEAQQLIDKQWQVLSEHLKLMDISVAGDMPLNDMMQKNMALIQANNSAFFNSQNQQQYKPMPNGNDATVEQQIPAEQQPNVMDLQQLSHYMDKVLMQSNEQINKVIQGSPLSFDIETNK